MTPFYSLSPGGVEVRNPDNIMIMRKTVDEHPDSRRMGDESADFGISWSGNGYSRRNTWIIADQEHTINLEEAR